MCWLKPCFFPANQRKKCVLSKKSGASSGTVFFVCVCVCVFGLAEKNKSGRCLETYSQQKVLHPRKKKMDMEYVQITPLKRKLIFNSISFDFHLSFQGCTTIVDDSEIWQGNVYFTCCKWWDKNLFTIDRRRISASTTGIGSSKPARWGSCWVCVGFLSVFFSVVTGWNLSEFSWLDGNGRNYQPKSQNILSLWVANQHQLVFSSWFTTVDGWNPAPVDR